jgi:hypothetical protein
MTDRKTNIFNTRVKRWLGGVTSGFIAVLREETLKAVGVTADSVVDTATTAAINAAIEGFNSIMEVYDLSVAPIQTLNTRWGQVSQKINEMDGQALRLRQAMLENYLCPLNRVLAKFPPLSDDESSSSYLGRALNNNDTAEDAEKVLAVINKWPGLNARSVNVGPSNAIEMIPEPSLLARDTLTAGTPFGEELREQFCEAALFHSLDSVRVSLANLRPDHKIAIGDEWLQVGEEKIRPIDSLTTTATGFGLMAGQNYLYFETAGGAVVYGADYLNVVVSSQNADLITQGKKYQACVIVKANGTALSVQLQDAAGAPLATSSAITGVGQMNLCAQLPVAGSVPFAALNFRVGFNGTLAADKVEIEVTLRTVPAYNANETALGYRLTAGGALQGVTVGERYRSLYGRIYAPDIVSDAYVVKAADRAVDMAAWQFWLSALRKVADEGLEFEMPWHPNPAISGSGGFYVILDELERGPRAFFDNAGQTMTTGSGPLNIADQRRVFSSLNNTLDVLGSGFQYGDPSVQGPLKELIDPICM